MTLSRKLTYEIFSPPESERSPLFQKLSDSGKELTLRYDEEPIDYNGIENVAIQQTGSHEHLIRPPFTYDFLSDWLSFGNWTAFTPAVKGLPNIDSFRKEEEALNLLSEFGIEVLIDSFHDDVNWKGFRKR